MESCKLVCNAKYYCQNQQVGVATDLINADILFLFPGAACRVGLDPWCGNSEDLWKVIGAPILLSTSEEVVCEIAVAVFNHLGCFTDQANVACDQILQFMETGFHPVTTSKVGLCTRCKSSVFP